MKERAPATKMKAAVFNRYGPPEVVAISDVPRPVPGDGDVLIKVRASTVNSADWRIRSLTVPPGLGFMLRLFFGVFRPRKPVLGMELAGTVTEVGSAVTRLAIGDEVIAYPGSSLGAHAEYIVMPEDGRLVKQPSGMAVDTAASLAFGGITALHFLRDKAAVKVGERVLVIGATGTVGSAAVQLARHFGADVTAVTITANADLALELGAREVIDYQREDVTAGERQWDVIVDAVGSVPLGKADRMLASNGRLLMVVANLPDMLRSIRWGRDGKRAMAGSAPERVEDLRTVVELVEQGAFSPLIDSRYPLEKIVDAHRQVDSRHKRGSVIVTMHS